MARRASSTPRSSRARPTTCTFLPTSLFRVRWPKPGFAAGEVKPYALGRIVLWSTSLDARQLTLDSLTDPKITRIAMANPKHAPYGKRAEEALRAVRCVGQDRAKLVYGENIAHTAQFVQTGNAQVGIIALALAVNPELAARVVTG
jgi:molybdate transport system substrate-binding protein